MAKTQLEELLPEMPEFVLASTGDHVHKFRKVSLADQVWLKETFADVENIFKKKEIGAICRIAFRFLTDKTPFKAKEVTFVDEHTGEETHGKIGGAALLLESMAMKEFEVMLLALTKAFTLSQPELTEVMEAALKKSALPANPSPDMQLAADPTGPSSST